MRLRLSAVWVTMVAFEAPVPVPGGMEGAQTYNTSLFSTATLLACLKPAAWLVQAFPVAVPYK